MTKIKIEYKNKLAESAKLLYEKGFSPCLDFGDVSIVDPESDYIYICPNVDENYRVQNWGETKAEDICVVDKEGKLIEDIGLFPTVELPMHLSIYKARPEVKAIIHSHAMWSTAYAITRKNIPLVLTAQATLLGGEILCAEYGLVGSDDLGKNVVKALGKNKRAALMSNHGAVIVGRDINEAFACSEFFEKAIQSIIMGNIIGKVIEINPDNVLDAHVVNPWI